MSENNYPEMPSEQSSSVSNLDRICGIDEQFIENKKEYQSLINDMKCPMCGKEMIIGIVQSDREVQIKKEVSYDE